MIRFLLSEFGASFATRGRGQEVREEILRRADASDGVVVDLRGVEHVSYSFADECLGKLCVDETLSVDFENSSPGVGRTVEQAVLRRRSAAVPC